MNAVLILNHEAGSLNGSRDAITPRALSDAFEQAGLAVDVHRVAPRALPDVLRARLADRPARLLVGGGDGTVSTAAGVLAGTDTALGVVPLGTLNHFARDLGLPKEWRAAVAALATGEPRQVDVAEVNGRVFINNCSLGSYPEAVRTREALRRDRGHAKMFAMLMASIAVFRRLRRLRIEIKTPEAAFTLRTPFVLVGNNAYSGHLFDHSLRPRLDDGRLWIYTTRAHRRLALLRLAWQSLVRTIDAADELESHATTEATITETRGRALPIAIDGELAALDAPLRFRIRPRALRAIAPVRPAS